VKRYCQFVFLTFYHKKALFSSTAASSNTVPSGDYTVRRFSASRAGGGTARSTEGGLKAAAAAASAARLPCGRARSRTRARTGVDKQVEPALESPAGVLVRPFLPGTAALCTSDQTGVPPSPHGN